MPMASTAHHDSCRYRVPAPLLPPRAAQRLRAHPPLWAAVQPLPKPATATGPYAAGAGPSPSNSTTHASYSGGHRCTLALPEMRRTHVRRSKTHCRRVISVEAYRFLITLRSNPGQRLAPRTPMRSCLHSLIRHATSALLYHMSRSKDVNSFGSTSFHQQRC
jgi:hypothetical protein